MGKIHNVMNIPSRYSKVAMKSNPIFASRMKR